MSKMIALSVCLLFILWLFARDRRLRPIPSWELWIPLLWFSIIGTRFISDWFSTGRNRDIESAAEYLEGSLLDRNIFLFLIIAGVVVLFRRRLDWGTIFNSNRWFFVFFIYCAISIIWSDYAFVSFKRWTKELGNVIMVLIILTEEYPLQALRAVLSRYAYIAIPLSLVLIYFYPEFGVQYSLDTSELTYCGITGHKNALGMAAFICTLFLIWELIYMRSADDERGGLVDLFTRWLLIFMATWLMYLANSKTPLICLVFGMGILVLMKLTSVKGQVRYIGSFTLACGALLLFLNVIPSIISTVAKMVGRDETFTGRTDLWADLLREDINPLWGTGYQSFWLGARADYLWEKYLFHPTQAHNGYLEIYLNGGLVGLGLLMVTIIVAYLKLKNQVLGENRFAVLLFAFLLSALFYNLTEARFSTLNLLWVILSMAALYCPPSSEATSEEESAPGGQDHTALSRGLF